MLFLKVDAYLIFYEVNGPIKLFLEERVNLFYGHHSTNYPCARCP